MTGRKLELRTSDDNGILISNVTICTRELSVSLLFYIP